MMPYPLVHRSRSALAFAALAAAMLAIMMQGGAAHALPVQAEQAVR